MKPLVLLIFLSLWAFFDGVAGSPSPKTTAPSRLVDQIFSSSPQEQTLTIYPEDLCMVKEYRDVSLSEGKNRVVLEDVPSQLLEDSVLFSAIDDQSLIFTEFSFHSDLLTFHTLLEKSLGELIYVFKRNSRKEWVKSSGSLLGIEKNKALVQLNDQIELIPFEHVAFQKIPMSLSLHPFLRMNVRSPRTQNSRLQVTYLTKGLSWKTNYTVEIDFSRNEAALIGWVTIQNASGTHFKHANIQLASMQKLPVDKNFSEKRPHIYPLSGSPSLYNGAQKKVFLSSAYKINAQKEYRIQLPNHIIYEENSKRIPLNTQVWFAIQNLQKNSLGFPLPPGQVKIYGQTPRRTRYVGFVDLKHTNIGDSIYFPVDVCKVVEAFIQQTSFKQLGAFITENSFRLTITNKNDKPLTVTAVLELPADTTLMRSSSSKYQVSEGKILWPLTVPVNQTVSFSYRLRVVKEKKSPPVSSPVME
jgi:hypothetical protein